MPYRLLLKSLHTSGMLAAEGADWNWEEDGINWAAVHYAAEKNNRAALKVLIEAGADLKVRDAGHLSAYDRATHRKDLATAFVLGLTMKDAEKNFDQQTVIRLIQASQSQSFVPAAHP